jgi:hypothetical protein
LRECYVSTAEIFDAHNFSQLLPVAPHLNSSCIRLL